MTSASNLVSQSRKAIGTAANNLLSLNSSAQIPAVDGSLITGIVTTGRLLRAPRWITASGTYTTPADCQNILVEMIGGGGGGGGGGSSSGDSGGNGGAGGGYGVVYITTVTPSTNYTVTIGSGGAGTTGAGNRAASGGTTSIVVAGTTYSAAGGQGGASGYSPVQAQAVGGGTTNCTISVKGENGGKAALSGVAADGGVSAGPYTSPDGAGKASTTAATRDATSIGCGAGGYPSATSGTGGTGDAGAMRIWEFS